MVVVTDTELPTGGVPVLAVHEVVRKVNRSPKQIQARQRRHIVFYMDAHDESPEACHCHIWETGVYVS